MVTCRVVGRVICATYRVTVRTFGVGVRTVVTVFWRQGVYGFDTDVLVWARRLS